MYARSALVALLLVIPTATAGPVGFAYAALCGNDPMIDGGAWERVCDAAPIVLIVGPATLDAIEATCAGDDAQDVDRAHCRAMDGAPSQGSIAPCSAGEPVALLVGTIDGALRIADEGICHEHWSTARHVTALALA